jgi:type IV pilus assembly protein PilM
VIRRIYPALDVTPGELRGVVLHRKGRGVSLDGGRVLSLKKEDLTFSLREPNILEPRRFVEAVGEVLNPLAAGEERIALSLPDGIGRVLLTETESVFKSKKEGIEILKWQLKNSLPGDPKDVQLDYQVLKKNDTGRYTLAVAFIANRVLHQYEELLAEAGYHAAVIDFHSLHVYNYYRPRLDPGEDFILVGIEGGSLSIQLFQGGELVFHRARDVQASPVRVFQELSRSVVGCHEKFPGFRRATLFLHSDWPDRQPLVDALRSAFERDEVVQLEPHLERLAAPSLQVKSGSLGSLVAAVGAAERML